MLIVLASSFIFRIWSISAIFSTGNPVLVRTLAGGLKGTKIEPIVPLLTFIGDINLDKSIENEYVLNEHKKGRNKSTVRKKKKRIHF